MTKKDLQQFRKLQIELESIEEQIARLDAKIKKATASFGMSPRGGKSADKEDRIIKLLDLKEDYEIRGGKIIAEQMKIEKGLDKLSDPVEKAVLRYRYIDNMDWEDIQIMIGYEKTQTFKIHSKAIKNLQKIQSADENGVISVL